MKVAIFQLCGHSIVYFNLDRKEAVAKFNARLKYEFEDCGMDVEEMKDLRQRVVTYFLETDEGFEISEDGSLNKLEYNKI